MFPQAWRLTRVRDVQKVYRHGLSAASAFLFIRILSNRLKHPRITVVIGKKVAKKAVVRNRLKRLVRQALQELMIDPKVRERLNGQDVVITIHRDPRAPYSLAMVKPEVSRCIDRLPR